MKIVSVKLTRLVIVCGKSTNSIDTKNERHLTIDLDKDLKGVFVHNVKDNLHSFIPLSNVDCFGFEEDVKPVAAKKQ